MPAKITQAILPEASELVRDRIFQILTDEIPNQATLLSDAEVNATVHKERVVPIGYEQCPAVNVMLEKVTFNGQTQASSNSEMNFIIDIFTKGISSNSKSGDADSAEKCQKIMRLVRGILEAPVYKTLDFPPGFILRRKLATAVTSEPRDTRDGKHMMMIRVNFNVEAGNTNVLQGTRELELAETQMKLYETDKGHLLEKET